MEREKRRDEHDVNDRSGVQIDEPANGERATGKQPVEEDRDIFYGQRDKNDRRIVLVGRTGAGKSATGNTILQMKVFKSKASGSSITKYCERETNQISGKRLIVIDTPGLFDTKLPQGKLTQEIIRCISMSAPGPHVFLLVLRAARFTQEEINTFILLFDIFGERMSEFSIIAFTHLDDLEHDESSIEEFISNSDEALKKLLHKVKNRYLAFNNRGSAEQKCRQSDALLKFMEEIVEGNGGRCYTNELYKEAEENLRSKIKEVERIKAEEKQREIEKIEEKFIGKIEAAEKSNEMLSEEIKKQIEKKIQLEQAQETKDREIKQIKKEMQNQTTKHQTEIINLKENDLKQLKTQLQSLLEKESKNQDRINSQLREINDMKSQFKDEKDNIEKDFQDKMNKYVNAFTTQKSEITELNTEVRAFTDRLSEAVTANAALMQTINDMKTKHSNEIAELQEKLDKKCFLM